MSRKTVFTCDRCKKRIQGGFSVYSFDFGKDYAGGKESDRVQMDLCGACRKLLMRFLGVYDPEGAKSDKKVGS